jgi:hypothetical protein
VLADPSLLLHSLHGRQGLRVRQLARLLDVGSNVVLKEVNEARRDETLREVLRGYARLSLRTFLGVNDFAGEALYSIVKILKPDVVVETGVSAGVSSAFILEAMDVLEHGELHSIDLPGEVESGLLVPERLRSRWELIKGPSRQFLPPLLTRLHGLDVFFHDSEHSEENMKFEFEESWPLIRSRGLLLADDSASNNAFQSFIDRRQLRAVDLFAHSMAGVRKP